MLALFGVSSILSHIDESPHVFLQKYMYDTIVTYYNITVKGQRVKAKCHRPREGGNDTVAVSLDAF